LKLIKVSVRDDQNFQFQKKIRKHNKVCYLLSNLFFNSGCCFETSNVIWVNAEYRPMTNDLVRISPDWIIVNVDVPYVLTDLCYVAYHLGAHCFDNVLVPRDISIISADSLIQGWDSGWIEYEVSWDIANVSADSLLTCRNTKRVYWYAPHDSLDLVWVCLDLLEQVTDLQLVQPDTITIKGNLRAVGSDCKRVCTDVCFKAGEHCRVYRSASTLATTACSNSSTDSSDVCLNSCDLCIGSGDQLVVIDRKESTVA